jgi:hypothetical protein
MKQKTTSTAVKIYHPGGKVTKRPKRVEEITLSLKDEVVYRFKLPGGRELSLEMPGALLYFRLRKKSKSLKFAPGKGGGTQVLASGVPEDGFGLKGVCVLAVDTDNEGLIYGVEVVP